MIKAPSSLQDLRRRMYRKAKSDKTHRFWGLFVHLTKPETLAAAYQQAKRNGGAPGVDGRTFADSESAGLAHFLEAIRYDLRAGAYQPQPNRGRRFPRGRARSVSSRFLASVIGGCKGH
jgi:retron-type reverse transcriptase